MSLDIPWVLFVIFFNMFYFEVQSFDLGKNSQPIDELQSWLWNYIKNFGRGEVQNLVSNSFHIMNCSFWIKLQREYCQSNFQRISWICRYLSSHELELELIVWLRNVFLDDLFEKGYLTYVINPLRSQNVLHSNPTIKPNDWQYKLSNIQKQVQNWIMKYCLIFYFYLTLATKDYTRHHRVGYSLDVDDDFSKIAVILHNNPINIT